MYKVKNWREFLSDCDFSGFTIDAPKDVYDDMPDCFIEEFTIDDLLRFPDIYIDEENKIIKWGEPVMIEEWDNKDLKFYLLFWWYDTAKEYRTDPKCYFEEDLVDLKKS